MTPATRVLPLLLLALSGLSPMTQAGERLVLVTATRPLAEAPLTMGDVRRLFLGRTVTVGDQAVRPLINKSDTLLYEVFLQKVVHMSAGHYERHLLSGVYRRGGRRPQSFISERDLIAALRNQPFTVTFLWESSARAYPGIHVVRELWLGQTH